VKFCISPCYTYMTGYVPVRRFDALEFFSATRAGFQVDMPFDLGDATRVV